MKRERVIANAALTLASGGKFKALLGQPFEILFFSGHCGWGTRSEPVCAHTKFMYTVLCFYQSYPSSKLFLVNGFSLIKSIVVHMFSS